MTFQEIDEQYFSQGNFTRSLNQLDDVLLRLYPNAYYCFFHYMWRNTFGWQKSNTADRLHFTPTMKVIAIGANIGVKEANRAAWFFHYIHLLRFTPGKKGISSQFELFPISLDVEHVKKAAPVLHRVLALEKQYQKKDRGFRFDNDSFKLELLRAWDEYFGSDSEAA